MVKSSGIFLVRKDKKILIAHPTNQKKNHWSIPKGRIEKDEEPIDAAVREMFEEANVDLSNWKMMHNLPPIKYHNIDKILFPFVCFEHQNDIDFKSFELKCNTNIPIESGGFPEMDDYKWVTVEKSKQLLHPIQVICLDKIEHLINRLDGYAKEYKKR